MSSPARSLYFSGLSSFYDGVEHLGVPLIRVGAGLMLMPHGAQKLFGMFGGGGVEGTTRFFASVHVEPAAFFAVLVGCVEFFGGLMLALGLLTRFAAGAIAIQMAYLVFALLWANGYFLTPRTPGGFEFALLWGLVALGFALAGGGRYSLDRAIGKEL
jgi:putative oxidoreductase